MLGSIERLRHHVRRMEVLAAVPMMLIVGSPTHPDPIKHGPGKGGVLPIPATAAPPTSAAHLDSLLNGHRDSRLERGRVLYAPGHAPRDTAITAHPGRKHTCPTTAQRVVAERGSAGRPIS
ncbi:MAG TPA: hypothetical protein VH277_14985 [Gemmatimonadaceae bacterium]|jgi:hypothetical protein|nr:hypothetical protein [Gemmatimonadaceae bacterium]